MNFQAVLVSSAPVEQLPGDGTLIYLVPWILTLRSRHNSAAAPGNPRQRCCLLSVAQRWSLERRRLAGSTATGGSCTVPPACEKASAIPPALVASSRSWTPGPRQWADPLRPSSLELVSQSNFNAVALADAGRDREIRNLGEGVAAPESVTRLIRKLAAGRNKLPFWYESRPTGYRLHRQITKLWHTE